MIEPFRKLTEQFRDRVYTYALYSLQRPEEAEDVTQDVLVKLWKHHEGLEPERLAPWVMRVTRNACIDAIRRRQTQNAVFARDVDVEMATNFAVVEPNAVQDVERMEFRQTLETALAELDDPYRSIIVMREIQDMKYNEISQAMEIPLNTVKVYLHRGRRMLRELLTGRLEND